VALGRDSNVGYSRGRNIVLIVSLVALCGGKVAQSVELWVVRGLCVKKGRSWGVWLKEEVGWGRLIWFVLEDVGFVCNGNHVSIWLMICVCSTE